MQSASRRYPSFSVTLPILVLSAFTVTPAAAQDEVQASPPLGVGGRPGADADEWTISLGVAPIFTPAFEGSRDMVLSIFPDIRVNYGETFFASVPDGLGFNVINDNGWRAGPLAKVRFGRNEDFGGSPFIVAGNSNALQGLGDIDATAELGGFVERRFGPRGTWRLRAEIVRGFGGHEGLIAELSASHSVRLGGAIVSVGPRATLASDDFMQTYFGIDTQQSANSGLAIYNAKGGLLSYGLGGAIVRPIGKRSAITLFSSLERLGEEAADSPLVVERGRATQFTLGIGYSMRFGL